MPSLTPLSPEGATPAIAQWFAAKAEHPHALIFFRMGDFYELFFQDAEQAAAALDIQLTQRGSHAGEKINMCGVPVHAADAYLARLIRKGFRVAIAEQMEDPKSRGPGKAPLKRAVVRLVTAGTLTEEALLEPGQANFLLSLAETKAGLGAAWLDISTGSFETEAMAPTALPELLARLDPAEILAPEGLALGEWRERRAPGTDPPAPAAARRSLETFLGVAIDSAGSFSDAEIVAAAQALAYLRLTQAGALPHLMPPRPLGLSGRLLLDGATRASLEITDSRSGRNGSLLACVQHTLTAPGARLLAQWLAGPLTDLAPIVARQDGWSWLAAMAETLAACRAALKRAPDLDRALARLAIGRFTPRDLAAIRDGHAAARAAAAALVEAPAGLLAEMRAALELDRALGTTLGAALANPLPARLGDPGLIAAGFDGALDAERRLRDDSRGALAGMQLDLAQRYGVASLKIRHHQQLGYVLEVPTAGVERLRQFTELSLRQGMANGARFTCPDLSTLDERIVQASDRAAAREAVVGRHLVGLILEQSAALAAAAAALATLDVLQSAARLAESGRWCRPIVSDGLEFCIAAGRHPVVEAALAGRTAFIANDCDLSPQRRVLLLTGPNMAGKSTFLRQNALIVVLAQAGLPAPAASARIGLVDRLFSRVGSSDDLARGRSTFMVEMIETAAILNGATARSLVIVDEIGRGTATLDGLAIAWAVLEALHGQVRTRTVFATHFHELARLRHELPHLCPHTMRVKEWKGEVVFLHEVAEGAAGRSWGVQVAKLAGVPASVIRRAGAVLAALEARGAALTEAAELPLFAVAENDSTGVVPSPQDSLAEALGAIEPDRLTPKQALEHLYELKALLAETGRGTP